MINNESLAFSSLDSGFASSTPDLREEKAGGGGDEASSDGGAKGGGGSIRAASAHVGGTSKNWSSEFPSNEVRWERCASSSPTTKGQAKAKADLRAWRSRARPGDRGPKGGALEEFRMAVVHGDVHSVKAILDAGMAVDQILRSGWTAVMYASSCGKHEMLHFLLEKGADPNMHKEMFTALMAASGSSYFREADLAQCVAHLLAFGASVDASERHRMTALMFAAKEGRTSLVDRLVDAGADINKQDNKGWTALCWAAARGHGLVVRRLLKAGADPSTMNSYGQRASDIALAAGQTQVSDMLERALLSDDDGGDGDGDFASASSPAVRVRALSMAAVPAAPHCSEMEIVLTGIELSTLIPLFRKNRISLECFLRLTEADLEKMGVEALGTRKTLLEAIAQIHKQEWKTTSLPNLSKLPYITLPDAVAMVANINRHLRFIHASVGHLRDQIQAAPRILQLGQEKHTVATLAESFSDSMKNLSHLADEVRFFKAHLDKVRHYNEYTPADTVILKQDDGRRWQRRMLTSLAVATSVFTALYFYRQKTFSWLFSLSLYPRSSVVVTVNSP